MNPNAPPFVPTFLKKEKEEVVYDHVVITFDTFPGISSSAFYAAMDCIAYCELQLLQFKEPLSSFIDALVCATQSQSSSFIIMKGGKTKTQFFSESFPALRQCNILLESIDMEMRDCHINGKSFLLISY